MCLVYAARFEQFETVKWLCNKYPSKSSLCAIAAEFGNLTILQWLHDKGRKLTTILCSNAAKK